MENHWAKRTIKCDILLKEPSCDVTHLLEVTNSFTKHFSSIASDDVMEKCSNTVQACTESEGEITIPFSNITITEEEVIEKLYGIKNKTSSGIDYHFDIKLKNYFVYTHTQSINIPGSIP